MDALDFDSFWQWLQGHPNCILRIATQDAVLLDDDDLHWFVGPLEGALVAQVIRGKRLMGEMAIDPERVSYVTSLGEERKGEFGFEAIEETATDRVAAYTFVLAHDLDQDEAPAHGPGVH